MHKFLTFVLIIFLLSPTLVSAQQSTSCPSDVRAREPEACADLDRLIDEAATAQKEVDRLKGLGTGYANDIALLTAKINTAQANIKSKNNQISLLTKDIAVKQSKISALDTRIDKGRVAIADILRKTNDINSYSLVEAMLSDKNLSEFFVDVDTYSSTETALDTLFDKLRSDKAETEAEKAELNKRKEAAATAKAEIEAAKKQVEAANAEKKTLLAITNTNKQTYEQVVADKQAKAAQIRAKLFQLPNSTGPISEGLAIQYAQAAEAKTGVRAAFILGIFMTESGRASDGSFGGNVGQCLLTNSPSIGNGKGKNSGIFYAKVMRSDSVRDDVGPFMEITQSLGIDPYSQSVSCPQSIGYGGAMGPAQFIPSTWKLMIPKLSSALGGRTPNPWSAGDAFMASAFYLRDLGAAGGNYSSERDAAHRYNGIGGACRTPTTRYPNDYCNKSMTNAAIMQADIDSL